MNSPPLYRPSCPLADALQIITGVQPPDWVGTAYSGYDLGDRVIDLQDWCSDHARPEWSTGLGVLEAAEHIVELAVENANIPPPKKIRIKPGQRWQRKTDGVVHVVNRPHKAMPGRWWCMTKDGGTLNSAKFLRTEFTLLCGPDNGDG